MPIEKTELTDEMLAQEQDRQNELDAGDGTEDQIVAGNDGEGPTDQGDPEPQPEKRKPVMMSPQDEKRMAMAARFKRPDADRVFDGDLTKSENLYGEVAEENLVDDPAADEPGVPRGARQEAQPEPERKHKIIVRGKEVFLTDAELIERASKVEAADSYLQESRDLLEQAKQVRGERTAPSSQHPEGDSKTQDDGLEVDNRSDARRPGPDLKSVVEKIQFGDPEDAARDLSAAIATEAEKIANEGHVRRLVSNDLARSKQSLKEFREANPELDGDPIASNALENTVYTIYREEIEKLGVEKSLIPTNPADLADWHRLYRVHGHPVSKTDDVLKEAKSRFDKWRGVSPQKSAPRKDPARVAVNVDRTERRMNIPNQPSRTVVPRREQAKPTQETSRSAAVQEMRKARGQTVVT